jgi:phosphoribosylamine--glycine ligase
MGSYSPPSFFGADLTEEVNKSIIEPLIYGLASEGTPYRGVIYAGLMLTPQGPKVLEFNARFGDPETQVIMPRLESDLVDIFISIRENRLSRSSVKWKSDACVGVVMASGGYPGSYKTGMEVEGIDTVDDGVLVFHAGTKYDNSFHTVTAGGRVLTVVACGSSIKEARDTVYNNISRIHFEGGFYRSDIALWEVN